MSEINDGGPAFPHDNRAKYFERAGMSLRDYFAIHALQGALASGRTILDYRMDSKAQHAYAWADAMLKAREVKQ